MTLHVEMRLTAFSTPLMQIFACFFDSKALNFLWLFSKDISVCLKLDCMQGRSGGRL